MSLTQISTAGVKDDAVTAGKIPANAVGSSELADNSVDTNAIQDQAVALSKLPHGDGSSDGKFLRANNGADPTFETITGTTINNNADNRLITGSGTANTLNGESNLFFNGTNLGVGGTSPNYQVHATTNMAVGGHGFAQQLTFSNNAIQSLVLGTGYTNMSLNALGGNVGIGTTSPVGKLTVDENNASEHFQLRNTTNTSNFFF